VADAPHPEIIARGEAYFARHGGKSVFFGRSWARCGRSSR
jgi:hypothetical protein